MFCRKQQDESKIVLAKHISLLVSSRQTSGSILVCDENFSRNGEKPVMRCVFSIVAALLITFALAIPANADDVVGAVWKIEFKDDRPDIRIQCLKNGKVFGPAGKEIGTWKGKVAQAEITITDGGKRNGTYTITKLDKNPPTFRGKFKSDKGDDVLIKVSLIKD